MRWSRRGVAATLLAFAVAAVCVRLGVWQLDRLQQRRALNAAVRAQLARPALPLDAARARELAREPERFLYRRVRLRGVFDAERRLVLRSRAHDGRPGVHLVARLRLDDSPYAALVNRGWVPAADGATPDAAWPPEPGRVEVEAIVQPLPPDAGESRPVRLQAPGGPLSSYLVLDRGVRDNLAAATHGPLLPARFDRLSASPSASPPLPVPAPTLGEGNHLSYAVQWFSFAAIALGGWLLMLLRARRATR